jgi:hypothetical protein
VAAKWQRIKQKPFLFFLFLRKQNKGLKEKIKYFCVFHTEKMKQTKTQRQNNFCDFCL